MDGNVAYLQLAAFDAGPYIDLVKIAIVVVLLLAWTAGAQWVDRDTDTVKARREQWNLIVTSGGAVGTFVLLVVPFWSGSLFAVGIVFWVALAGGAMVGYIVHRNGRVVPQSRILTPGHAKRIIMNKAARKKVKDKGQRVEIADHAGEKVVLPDDPEEGLAFHAVQDFLFDVLWRRVSQADLVTGKEKYRLALTTDGVATEDPDGLTTEKGEQVIRFIKKIAGLNAEEIRRPQTGVIEVAVLGHEGPLDRAEVHTSGTTAGERLRIRILAGAKLLRLQELGGAEERFTLLKKVLGRKRGMFLVSAPPQNGLTTTLYALLRSHDAYMNMIHSLERDSLTELDNVTQHAFDGEGGKVSYGRALQTVLHKEPDIVMVGECEDQETAKGAARAAAKDRKIYMGIRARDTFDALARYVSLLGDPKLAARGLLGVMNQRLVRVLCTECREAFEPDPATLKKLNLPVDKIEHFYRPPSEPKKTRRGKDVLCPQCRGTGYCGRTGIFELLVIDEVVAKLIAAGGSTNRIKAQCRKNKMYYLQEEGLLKVIDGTTSMNEVLRCIRVGEK